MIERSRELYNHVGLNHTKDSYNESLHVWRLADGRMIEFGAIQFEKDKENQRGRPRSFYGWDEITEFSESMYRFVIAWNRTTIPGERCRVVATGNPPTSTEGEWVIRYWAPWLDEHYTGVPAKPGELRWFVRMTNDKGEDEDVEVPGPEPVPHNGDMLIPRSRTFIPAKLKDNPALAKSGYLATLQALPKTLRDQMLFGNFRVGIKDDAWQLIPAAWVRAAQARFTAEFGDDKCIDCVGADIARGGADSTSIAVRKGNWIAPIRKYQGEITDDGPKAAHLILQAYVNPDNLPVTADVNVDIIGVGGACYDALKDKIGARAVPINVCHTSNYRDRSGRFRLANVRSAMWWRLYEALDPDNGMNLMLPPGREILTDLCSVRFEPRASGIYIEAKDKTKERIGHSPDVGDSICLCLWDGGGIPMQISIVDGRGPDPEAKVYASHDEEVAAINKRLAEEAARPLKWGEDMFTFERGTPW